ncbi:MAG: c-type cytochrome [Gemmatimonadales bacterium]
MVHTPDGRDIRQKGGTPQPDLSAYRSPLESKIVDRRWRTADGMYLANEEFFAGMSFFLESVNAGFPIAHNNMFPWITAQEAYWYSRYILSNVFAQSHLGISMIHGPYWTLKARELSQKNRLQRDRGERVWANKDVFLGIYLPFYYKRTGWPRIFDDAAPTYLQYASGDPHFSGPIVVEDDFEDPQSDKKGNWGVPRYFMDWRSTRWDHDRMEIKFDMGGIGQTVKKQFVWVEYMFHSEHTEPSPSDPSVEMTLLGNDAEEGIRGTMLTLAGFNALLQAKAALFADEKGKKLGGINPFTYDPKDGLRYLPHKISPNVIYIGDLPERLWALDNIDDNSSRLWDQASWLWATAEYEWLAIRFEGKAFTDNPPVDAGIIEKRTVNVARGLSNVLVRNIAAMHTLDGVLVSRWTPKSRTGRVLHMKDAALALAALNEISDRRETNGFDPEIGDQALDLVVNTADFLLTVQADNGAFHEAYDVSDHKGQGGTDLSTPQWFGIRALIAAYHATADNRYRAAAGKTWRYLQQNFWDEASGLYRSKLGDDTVVLTPVAVAAAMGAMRELMIATPLQNLKPMIEQYTRWFIQTVDNSGFQMSEDNRTGELSYGVVNPDEDGDGIPFLKYGHGKYGIAPLPAGKVVVNIGGPTNNAFYRIKGDDYKPNRFSVVRQEYHRRVLGSDDRTRDLATSLTVATSTRLTDDILHRLGQDTERPQMERFNGMLIPMPASQQVERGSDLSGEEIYKRNCMICHGSKGEGITGKPLLTISTDSRDAVFEVPKKGRYTQGMPPWGQGLDQLAGVLTDEEIDRVVEYIRTRLFAGSDGNHH